MHPIRYVPLAVLLALLTASASAQPFDPVRTILGESPGERFGTSIASGDVDGDGFGDVLVRRGSPYADSNVPTPDASLDLFFGEPGFPAAGLTRADAALTLTSPIPGDQSYGTDFALGDLTGDGFDEIVVGAPGDGTNGPLSGAVYVYCGGPALDATPDVIIYGPPNLNDIDDEGMALGREVALGDLNGDGVADLVAFGYTTGSIRSEAYVFLGGAGFCTGAPRILQAATDADALVRIRGSEIASGHLALGDVNGDGLLDIAILDTGYHISGLGLPGSPEFPARGAVFVFYSSAALPALRENENADVRFAGGGLVDPEDEYESLILLTRPLAFGDLDGDGFDDLAVGGALREGGGTPSEERFVYVFYGGAALPAVVYAIDADSRLAFDARQLEIGDPDGDGTNDLLALTAGGTIYSFTGGAPFPPTLLASARAYTLPGGPFAVLANVNGGACPGLGAGDPTFSSLRGRALFYTCEGVDTTPPECGRIVIERDAQGQLTAIASSASDPESGIMALTFTRLRNLRGYAQGEGPFTEGQGMSFGIPYPTTVAFRGERINFSAGGALLVTVYNGVQLSSVCDPVIAQLSATAPEATSLAAPYPNPASGPVVLRFALAEAGAVALTVYDVAGREVVRLVEAEMEAGHYEATWAAVDLAAGTYVVRLAAGRAAHTQRLTLVR